MIFLNGHNMMNLQSNTGTSTLVVTVAAFLTGVIVPFIYFGSELGVFGGINYTPFPAFPVPMIWSGSDTVFILAFLFPFVPSNLTFLIFEPSGSKLRVVLKGIIDFAPVVMGFVTRLVSHHD